MIERDISGEDSFKFCSFLIKNFKLVVLTQFSCFRELIKTYKVHNNIITDCLALFFSLYICEVLVGMETLFHHLYSFSIFCKTSFLAMKCFLDFLLKFISSFLRKGMFSFTLTSIYRLSDSFPNILSRSLLFSQSDVKYSHSISHYHAQGLSVHWHSLFVSFFLV